MYFKKCVAANIKYVAHFFKRNVFLWILQFYFDKEAIMVPGQLLLNDYTWPE